MVLLANLLCCSTDELYGLEPPVQKEPQAVHNTTS